jgi:hypothetical protein
VDPRRIRPAEWLAGVAGAVLLGSLFLPWFSTAGSEVGGWESLRLLDLITALVGVLGISLPLVSAGQEKTDLPIVATVAVWMAAIVEILLLAYRLLDPVGETREIGLYIGFLAAAGLAAATWWAMSLES